MSNSCKRFGAFKTFFNPTIIVIVTCLLFTWTASFMLVIKNRTVVDQTAKGSWNTSRLKASIGSGMARSNGTNMIQQLVVVAQSSPIVPKQPWNLEGDQNLQLRGKANESSVQRSPDDITTLSQSEILLQKDILSEIRGIALRPDSGALSIVWNELRIFAKIAALSGDCDNRSSHPFSVVHTKLLRIHEFTYEVDGNLGENTRVAIRCDELAYHAHLTALGGLGAPPATSAPQTTNTTIWIRLCPQIGAFGLRIGGLDSSLSECRGQLRLTVQVAAAPLDWDRSTLWAVSSPQHLYIRCTLAQAAAERDCFGKYDTLYGPMVFEAFAKNGSGENNATDSGGYRVISLSSAQGWRSPGLRLSPMRTALSRSAINLKASVEFADSYDPMDKGSSPPPPFPALAARGVVTTPFIVLAVSSSFAALRNGAEAVNHAYNSVCTLVAHHGSGEGSASPTRGSESDTPVFATAASLHLPYYVPARDLAGGKVLRVVQYMDKAEVARCALEAKRSGFRFILIDAGWYGPELEYHSNPLAPEALRYAASISAAAAQHGVGAFLYINRRHLEQHMPGLAGALRLAGAAGVKFGFVNFTSTKDVEAVVGWAHACLREGLLVNTHDDLLPSGLQLLMPNMISFEAVRGNEAFPPPIHSVRVGLVRGLAGAADYTPVVHSPRRHLPPVHVLALPVLLFNPLQHLYFYSLSSQVAATPAYFRRVWAAVPTTWAQTLWLSGHPDTHASVARRAAADGSWYFCTLCAADAGGCSVDLRSNVRVLIGCGRPLIVETFLDAGEGGNQSAVLVPPARLDSVCDEEKGQAQLRHVRLAAGQAVLVWIRPNMSFPDPKLLY